MSVGYDGEASGGVDLTTASDSLGRGESLSENKFGFRKGRSSVDAIQAVVNITTNARWCTKMVPDYRFADDR